jgi:histidinol dehydrogenase
MTFIVVADESADVDDLVGTVAHGIQSTNPARILLVTTDASVALDAVDALDRLVPRRREAWALRGTLVVADDVREAACIVAAASPATIALRVEDGREFMARLAETMHPAIGSICAVEQEAEPVGIVRQRPAA